MDMRFGTWNTRSLHRSGALKELCGEMRKYKLDILAVQESRWKGGGIFDTRSHTVLYCGSEQRHEFGVAFIVDKGMKANVLGFTPVNERMCVLRVKTRFFNLLMINVHAETEDKNEITKDNFYNKLEQVYDATPSNDIKILIGDFNAKIGREPIYQEIVGANSLIWIQMTTDHV